MQEALHEIYRTMPLNNFTPFLKSRGIRVPDSLGGDCFDQAERLVDDLRRQGRDAVFAVPLNAVHPSVVVKDGDDRYFLDPSLTHNDPIKLDFENGPDGFIRNRGVDPAEETKIALSDNRAAVISLYRTVGAHTHNVWQSHFDFKDEYLLPNFSADLRERAVAIPADGRLGLAVMDMDLKRKFRVRAHIASGEMAIAKGGECFFGSVYEPTEFRSRLGHVSALLSMSPEDLIEIFNIAYNEICRINAAL